MKENDELVLEALRALTQETCALRDVLSLICLHLAHSPKPDAEGLASVLKSVAHDGLHHSTDAFVGIADQLVLALTGQVDQLALRSLEAGPKRMERAQLREVLRVVSRPPSAP